MAETASESDLQQVKRMYDALAAGNLDGVFEVIDDDATWIEAEGFPTAGTYRGHEEIMDGVFAVLGSDFEDFSAVPERYVVGDGTVVAIGTYSGTSVDSGTPFEVPFAHVIDLEDGKIARFQQFTDTALVQAAT